MCCRAVPGIEAPAGGRRWSVRACHVALFHLNRNFSLNSELSVGDEEELAGVGVPVPGELALNYHDPGVGTEHQCPGLISPSRTGSSIPEPLSRPAPVGSVAGNGRCGVTDTGSTEPAVAAAGDLPRRQGETVLITGASSGIGRELARLFAGDGAKLVLVARSESRLRELAGELVAGYGVHAQVVPADLSQPTASSSDRARTPHAGPVAAAAAATCSPATPSAGTARDRRAGLRPAAARKA